MLFEVSFFINGVVNVKIFCFVFTTLDKSFNVVGKLLYGSFKLMHGYQLNLYLQNDRYYIQGLYIQTHRHY